MTSPPRTLILLGILGLVVTVPATLATADETVSAARIVIVSNDISNTTISFGHAASSESNGSDAQAAGDDGDAAVAGSGGGDNADGADGAESPNGAAPDSESSADSEADGGGSAPAPRAGGGGGGGGGGCVETGTFKCDDEYSWSRSD